MPSTFDLLHEKVQKFIYKQKWDSFRPIQDDAIQFIEKEEGNLLIFAPTASGKTEAAFLPIVSQIADDFDGSFRAIYISPLKALINDQFRRIDELCKEIGIPVTKWHGDVGQNIKQKALRNPRGILLITPESLEAILIRKPTLARGAFSKLQFIVIDEIHSFVGSERGAQLYSLIKRINAEAGAKPRKIALSATVGNPNDVARWLSPTERFKVSRDEDWNDDSGIEGIIKGFVENTANTESQNSLLTPKLIESLYLDFLNGKNLIFGNSKKKLEETAFATKSLSIQRNSKTDFLVHHGSLSKETRELTELELKESNYPVSVFCTSTLEMGIDIGKIEKIGIIDPPWSVSGFAQRLGRSGRRAGSTKKFEFLIAHEPLNSNSHLSELIREDLVKSIAVVLLHLEGFKEPLVGSKPHFSTLVHQILAYCSQKRGAKIDDIESIIFQDSFRGSLAGSAPKELLQYLVKREILYQDQSGLLVPGRIGEKIADHYEFYSVFQTSEQWSIVHDGQLIGQIPLIGVYKSNDLLLLGGRVWLVNEVNETAKRIVVEPAKKARAPLFNASFGLTHPRIHEKMAEIYSSQDEYEFLDDCAKALLNEGRDQFRHIVKPENQKIAAIFSGTAVQNTISACLNILKIEHGATECLLEIRDDSDWRQKLKYFLSAIPTALNLAVMIEREKKCIEKYDHFLPEDLLNHSYAETYIDLEAAKIWISKLR